MSAPTLVSPFAVTATAGPTHDSTPTDWPSLKNQIVARLDIRLEYEALGVRFTAASPSPKGFLECHAVDRKDDSPSAAVNVLTGVYVDRGGEGVSLGFLDFALQHGQHGRWIDCVKHYAGKAGVEVGRIQFGKEGRVLEHVYEYYDAGGELRYGVFRYRLPNGKKDFRQFPYVNGDYKRSPSLRDGVPVPLMEGVDPLPYRLPELLETPTTTPVLVVEGEKDVDVLVSLGFVATTNSQGSKSTDATWPKFVEHFRDRVVVVIPDNDATGRTHAHAVAGYLKSVAASVQYLELPNLPLKGDVSDWLDRGGEVPELLKLVDSAPVWSEESKPEPRDPKAWAHAGDLRCVSASVPWVWDGWILGGALSLLAAEPGVGKTRFQFDLMRRIANGLPWPDGTTMSLPPSSRFVIVAADGQHAEIPALCSGFAIPDEQVFLSARVEDLYGGTMLETKDQIAEFAACVEEVKPRIVFIDTIGNTSTHGHYSNEDAMKRYKPLAEIAKRSGAAIVCVIHTNAKGKALGRRAEAQVRTVIQLAEPDPENDPHRLRLWVTKSFAVKPDALGVTRGANGNTYDTNPPALQEPEPEGGKRQGQPRKGPAPTKQNEMLAWVKDYLSKGFGRARVTDLRAAYEAAGYAASMYYKLKDAGLVIEERVDGRLWASLPTDTDANVAPEAPY